MKRQEEFLAKVLQVHRDYEGASEVLRTMLRANKATGPDWDAAVTRQAQALEMWSELLQEFADIHSGGVDGGG